MNGESNRRELRSHHPKTAEDNHDDEDEEDRPVTLNTYLSADRGFP